MNLLFLTLLDFDSINEHNIYTDLLREFCNHGHKVYVISPIERRSGKQPRIIHGKNSTILKLRIGNTQKTNIIEKGISTVTLESIFIRGIKRYFSDVKFDLLMYSTPPITFQRAVEYVKRRDAAKTYLLLKDIFPQNAVDIGMLSKNGWKGLIYKYFRKKEKRLYEISDHIGCMSEANCKYILKHNPEINPEKVEVCPNCIEVQDMSLTLEERNNMRNKYGIPLDKIVFVYGGNLGKPQGIPFLVACLKTQMKNEQAFFLIVGDGTEFNVLAAFFEKYKPKNMKLMKRLPKDDYDRMIAACDVGMIFLDHRFTIPNFPSRLLSYMQAKLPVLAVTDPSTDIGKVIVEGGFGWWCESNNSVEDFKSVIREILNVDALCLGEKAYVHLQKSYNVEYGYKVIQKGIK
mgnify:CR=1 FL=1